MKKKTSIYVLTTALAVSLSINATLLGAGVSEAQGLYKQESLVTNITPTPEGKVCFEACLDSAVCPTVDTLLGLTGVNACSAAKHAKAFCTQTQRDNTVTDSEGATSPAPDTMSLSGTSFHDMTLIQGKPTEIP